VLALLLAILTAPAGAAAANPAVKQKPAPEQATPHAPSGAPLSAEGTVTQGEPAASPPSGGDALVENGLGSPMCKHAGELPAAAQRSCEIAGFVAAPDPTGDYAFDVNIDTGITSWGNDIAATIQDFAGFGWMMFVSISHGLVVMFEWCYSVDLLRDSVLEEITRGLHGARASFTEPWLAFALTAASVFVVYHGLVRRRVAETLGQTLAMLAMMAIGLWLIANPAGTIGALDHWADEAGLGTLATVASGSPEQPRRTLVGDVRVLFSATVGAPWCYMEFGNIDWCEGAGALDPQLAKAGLAIARKEQSESGCRSLCGPKAGPKNRALAASAALLREAKSNGELFLALPANEEARNSSKEEWSLFSVLCGGGGEPADKCTGRTAAQAEFRSEKGTQPRLIGMFLIWMGGLGMLLLFGFLALHLLSAAIRTLVFLLVAPAAVIAPAFGEGGRSLFRAWMMRLLAAVVSKLVFSFLLGAMLMMMNLLLHLTIFGWLAQWFLLSSFWWGVFFKRHQMVEFLQGVAQSSQTPPRSIARRVKEAFETPRAMLASARSVGHKLPPSTPDVQKRRRRARATHEAAHARADDQVTRVLDGEHERAVEKVGAADQSQSRIFAWQEQLGRLRREQTHARAEGDRRRAARLGVREQRVAGEVARDQSALTEARRKVAEGESTKRLSGTPHTREQRALQSRFLDAQAALPAAGCRTAEGLARDYAPLAALAGYGAGEYRRLHPGRQREVRLQVDRELAMRSQLGSVSTDLARRAEPAPKRGERSKAGRELERALGQRMRDEGRTPLSERPKQGALDKYHLDATRSRAGRRNARADGGAASGGEASGGTASGARRRSPVMEDAFAVANRRKRQLGWEPRA
jgi:hypothetical protein